jgi:predicted house-cleaning noncanonical NTP pyrophosphatase (MazG superfamily)
MKPIVIKETKTVLATAYSPFWYDKLESDFPNGKSKICNLCCNYLACVLYKKNNFFIQLNSYPLIEAHLLINSVSHIFSFAMLNMEMLNELDRLHQQVRLVLQKEYAPKGLGVIFFEHGSTISEEKKICISGGSVVHAHLHAVVVPKDFDFMAAVKHDIGNNDGLKITEIKEMSAFANREIIPEHASYLFIENVDGRMWIIIITDTRCLQSMFLLMVITKKLGISDLGAWKTLSDSMRASYSALLENGRKKLVPAFEKVFVDDEEIGRRNTGLVSLENIKSGILNILYLGSSSKRLLDLKKLLILLIEDIKNTVIQIDETKGKQFEVVFNERRAINGGFGKGVILDSSAKIGSPGEFQLVRDNIININQKNRFHYANHHEYWDHLLLKMREEFKVAQTANIDRKKMVLIEKLADVVEVANAMHHVIEISITK